MNNDGSQTPLGLVLNEITDGSGTIDITNKFAAGIKNGSFSTRDQTPPVITIDSPCDGAKVSQDIMVNATITDVGGVNPDSIKVYVGNTAVNFTKKLIPQGCIVNATHTVQNLGQYEICVEASDNSSCSNRSSINVEVQQSGITIRYPGRRSVYKQLSPCNQRESCSG